MREIKFRAWDENREKWVYFRLDEIVNINHESLTDDEWAFIQLKDVGQYTGLKDKNGREVYEEDIVRFKDWWDEEMVGEVRYSEKDMAFTIVNDFWDGFPMMYADDIEVIGNIYENPELLEEAEE
ncbi:MAG: YopX family protein [Candidatus Syntropharchaeia archaeon]